MTAALTTIKNALDIYVPLLEGPTRAYISGSNIYNYCLVLHRFDNGNRELDVKELSNFFLQTVHTLSYILEAKRLEIFKGTRWEKLFFIATVSLAFFNGLVFYKNHFRNSLAAPLISRISRELLPLEYPIKGITTLAFTIFEFHRRPKEVAICLLGGCVSWIQHRKASKTVRVEIAKVNCIIYNCSAGIRFYVGNKLERTLISTSYLARALWQGSEFLSRNRPPLG